MPASLGMLSSVLAGTAFYGGKRMTVDEWKKIQDGRHFTDYTHFDRRISLDNFWEKVINPDKVARHAFYPFIHYIKKDRKIRNGKSLKPKERDIYYASHKDSWIYRYYAFLLNEKYNERAVLDQIDDNSVAYRNNHPGKNNVDYSLRALEFIKEQRKCMIMIGDFTHFFDNLEHSYLKKRICDLLEVERLPEDFYTVYKSITGFSYVDMDDLLRYNHLEENSAGRKQLNKKKYVMTESELRKFKDKIKKHTNNKGIPQGSPISAVLANVYMVEVDKQIRDYIQKRNGFYMRYSDDFIAVIPDADEEEISMCYEYVRELLNYAGKIELQKEKTKIFRYEDNCIMNCASKIFKDQENGKNVVEFLGLSFDGETIRIRDRTITRYYNKVYRKARNIVKSDWRTSKGNKITGERLYKIYSVRGSVNYRIRKNKEVEMQNIRERNFFDYLNDTKKKASDRNFEEKVTERHMRKIAHVVKRNI